MTVTSNEFWGPTIHLLVYAHDEKKADVLDFMFEETRTLVFDNKPGCVCSVHPCSLVEAKIADHAKLLRNFPISLPVRYTNFEHWACDDLLHLVGKKPRPKKTPALTVATTETGSPSSRGVTAQDPTRFPHTIASSPSFGKKGKNMSFRGFNNLFKMCQSIIRRRVWDISFSKKMW